MPVIGEPLLHPVALTATALLLLNDHVLKRAFPGIVTGKLSDFAGMVFFPLLLWALADAVLRLLARRSGLSLRILVGCIAVTGIAFLLVKTTPLGAEAFRRLWAALQWPVRAIAAREIVPLGRVRVVMDYTDLSALPMLWIPYVVGRRMIRRASKDR